MSHLWVRTNNLFDEKSIERGTVAENATAAGATYEQLKKDTPGTTRLRCIYLIKTNGEFSLTINSNFRALLCFFDSNQLYTKEYTSWITSYQGTSPYIAVVIRRLDGSMPNLDDDFQLMINTGTTALPYEPYRIEKPLDHVYVKARTVNLFDKNNIVSGGNWYITTKVIASTNCDMFVLPCKPNTTYTVSRQVILHRFTVGFVDSFPLYTDQVVSGTAVASSGYSVTTTSAADSAYIVVYYAKHAGTDSNTAEEIQQCLDTMMVVEGSTAPSQYVPYIVTKEAWEARDKNDNLLWGRADTFIGTNSISARCYGLSVKSWEIDGNSQQSGTPAQDAPIMPEFVGERTENWFSSTVEQGTIRGTDGAELVSSVRIRSGAVTVQSATYTISSSQYLLLVAGYSGTTYTGKIYEAINGATKITTITIPNGTDTIRLVWKNAADNDDTTAIVPVDVENIMLNAGSTALPYEPYGYKLNITSSGQTQTVYLGQVQTLRRVRKLVLTGDEQWWVSSGTGSSTYYRYAIGVYDSVINDEQLCTHFIGTEIVMATTDVGCYVYNSQAYQSAGINIRPIEVETTYDTPEKFATYLSNQYAAGTPVTVWYVLAEPEIGIFNEPLAKIGTYADTLTSDQAGITIPTTDGSTTISVDTALAPSRFEVKVHAKPI